MSVPPSSEPDEMSFLELLFYTSLHLVVLHPSVAEPVSYGSGVLVRYRERLFLLSVAHVTDIPGAIASIETNLPPVDGQTPFLKTGALFTFAEHPAPKNLPSDTTVEQLLAEPGKRLDITFCVMPEPFALPLLQPALDLGGGHYILAREKLALQLDAMVNTPLSRQTEYALLGRIHQKVSGKWLRSDYALKGELRYQGSRGFFHRFLTPKIIKDADDFRGCSGAPILDEEGRMVALACSVAVDTRLLYAFSIEECRRLIDIAIDAGKV